MATKILTVVLLSLVLLSEKFLGMIFFLIPHLFTTVSVSVRVRERYRRVGRLFCKWEKGMFLLLILPLSRAGLLQASVL